MLSQFSFVRDNIFYGKKQSDIARDIRNELYMRHDTKPVSFFSKDSIKLAGILVRRQKPSANLVLCHGYRGSKEFMYEYVNMFPQFNILMFDFRAHGESEGNVISIGCHEYKDIIAAVRLLHDVTQVPGGKELPMIVLGISMGGACAIKAVEQAPDLCDALIIDSAYCDLYKALLKGFTLKSGLPYFPFFPVTKFLFQCFANCSISDMKTIECVKKIRIPIMFIHSSDDSLTSPSHSIKLYDNSCSSQYTKLWIGPKCKHGMLHNRHSTIYKKKVLKFLKRAIPNISIN